MKKIFLVLLGACVLFAALILQLENKGEEKTEESTKPAHAQTPLIPKTVRLDNKRHEAYLLRENFLKLVFADYRTSPYSEFDLPYDPKGKTERFIKHDYPWVYEFIYRREGMPNPYSLTRWEKPVVVSLGLPFDLLPATIRNVDDLPRLDYTMTMERYGKDWGFSREWQEWQKSPPERLKQAAAFIPDVLKELETATGVRIRYLPHEKETPAKTGNLRIVFLKSIDASQTPFRVGMQPNINVYSGSNDYTFFINIERYIAARQVFTPTNEWLVNGYFTSNNKNEIEFAACYIWIGHSWPVIQRLIRECLLRSMGLPEQVGPKHSYLGGWNSKKDFFKIRQSGVPGDFLDDYTDYDLFMLKLLYNKRLKAGMSIQNVQRLLRGVE